MSETVKLFQYSTLSSLMAGLYKGSLTIGELLTHGDLGIGTVHMIDGELIVLDGKAYQAIGTDGKAEIIQLSDDVTVPYAAVLPHYIQKQFDINAETDNKDLEEMILKNFEGQNLFKSLKIKGTFSRMHVRMIPKSPQHKRFADIASNQPEFTRENVSGTLVGIWTPELFHGVGVKGFHVHFISDDLTFGGHVMDYSLTQGKVEIGKVDQLDQCFPTQDQEFLKANFDLQKLREDIDLSE
ncbi:TPA: acetolactate decarboxylase [Streptococcus agalactiae]|nr:acetolactate decarboxylase [Streptococcus agalactiae]